MFKKISFSFLCIAVLISSNSHSMPLDSTQPIRGVSLEYSFLPNQPQTISNFFIWSIDAHCIVSSESSDNELNITALSKKGKINDLPLSSGQSMKINVHPNDVLRIMAEPGAKVEITNLGQFLVKATCSM